MRLASKLSFFCYLNIEIERKKEEKFDSLLTLALINLEFHTHSLKSCHGVSKLAGGSELISPTGFHMTSLKFKLKTVDPTESYFHHALEQLKTNFHTSKLLFFFNSIDPSVCRSIAAFVFECMRYRHDMLFQKRI